MPGTPHSRGCEGCRKQKKRCDQVKPTCGRCKRLDVPCIGNGVKRWKFQSFQGEDKRLKPCPKSSPTNNTARVASSLVYILGIEDIRYDLRAFGGRLIPELPSQIGSNPALDACVSAMVSLYKSRQYSESKVDALAQYGDALTATRKTIRDPRESIVIKMRLVSIIFICQAWIDRKGAEKHREMISHLFREAILSGKLSEIEPDYIQGLTQLAVLANILNPKFELGRWFWDACKVSSTPRPARYQQGTFLSLESSTLAEASFFMRSPRKHLYQIQCMYNLVRAEKPKVRQCLVLATMATMLPTATPMAMRVCGSYRFAYSTMIALGSMLNHVLRIFYDDPDLLAESHDYVDEAISLTDQCASSRPHGASFIPDFLKMVWATITDSYRSTEIEVILWDYQHDVEGADYLEEALTLKRRLYRLAKRETQPQLATNPEVPMHIEPEIQRNPYSMGAATECVIL
ncbi:hypothetical protein FDECE_14962 [Fusarium decemcellulare]|nr:hypothetical protein FDECE_14962 [Fusarium decemcellulare]